MIASWLAALVLLLLAALPVRADPLVETRYCGAPVRLADGTIKRSAAVRAAFQRVHPCPSTGLRTGACPGWSVDHVRPLSACGCDSVSNAQWLKNEIKSCAGTICKDRWERWVYTCQQVNLAPAALVP